jgi:ABC-2 type transport system permease protein
MKRILALIRRDLLSTVKDQMMLYSIIGSLLLAFGLRFFLPSVGQAAVNVVVTPEMPPAVVQQLEDYLNVEIVDDRTALERRVLAYDDAVGIVPAQGGGYSVVLQGNEAHDSRVLPGMVLQRVLGGNDRVQVGIQEVAGDQVAFREIFGAFVGLAVLFVASMVMGFMIIEDKESRMLQALGISPLSRREYVAARGLLVLALGLILVFGGLLLMGVSGFDYLQIASIAVVASLVAILAGFVIGSLSSNQIAGIANVKFGMLLFLLPALLTLVIPEQFWVAFYWVPTYWAYTSFRAVLVEGTTWAALSPMLGWMLLTSLVMLAASYRWLKGNLDFARA